MHDAAKATMVRIRDGAWGLLVHGSTGGQSGLLILLQSGALRRARIGFNAGSEFARPTSNSCSCAARPHEQTLDDRSLRVLEARERQRVMTQPRPPEQVALLRAARLLVGERVEQRVQHLHRACQRRRGSIELRGSEAEDLGQRLDRHRERAKLVLDHRRRVLEQRRGGMERRSERVRERQQPAQRDRALVGERLRLAERLRRLLKRRRQQRQRLLEVRSLRRDRREVRVRRVDQ